MHFCLSFSSGRKKKERHQSWDRVIIHRRNRPISDVYDANKQNKTITVNCPASAQFIHSRNWLLDADCQIFFCSISLSFRVGLVRTKKNFRYPLAIKSSGNNWKCRKQKKTWRVYVWRTKERGIISDDRTKNFLPASPFQLYTRNMPWPIKIAGCSRLKDLLKYFIRLRIISKHALDNKQRSTFFFP